jgi:hypothetical protein
MKIRGLLVAAGLLILLGVGIWWSNRISKEKESKPPADASPKIVAVTEGDIRRIEVARRDGEKTVIEKDASGSWKMTSPASYPLDQFTVQSFVSAAASVSSDKVIEEKTADAGQYGLAQPALTLTLTLKDGKSKVLRVGDDAPAGSASYASAEGDPHIYTIASYTKESFNKTAADLRDKRMLTFNVDKLARITLAAKKTETEFGKNAQGEWQILKPKPYRADAFTVDDLSRRLQDVKLDATLSADDLKKNAAAFNSAAPLAVITATDAAGTQKLEIRKTKDDKYYARSSVVDGTYTVEASTAKVFDKSTDDFRNKKLFDFGFNDPSRIDFHGPTVQTSVAKGGEKWFRNGKPLESGALQSFLDKLRDLSATKYAETGFGTAAIDIAVVSGDGKKTEKVSLSKSGAEWLARRENEPALYVVSDQSVEDLEHAAAELKEEPAKPPAKK